MRCNIDFLKGKILIDIDYKQKIVLGNDPRVLNSEFFDINKKKVILLSFGVYYVDVYENKEKTVKYEFINTINIDVVSDYDGQNASDVIRIFKFVMNLDIFKKVDQPIWNIWSDCGKQFRCAEFNYFLFNSLAELGKSVSMNYFLEKHIFLLSFCF